MKQIGTRVILKLFMSIFYVLQEQAASVASFFESE